MDSEHLRNAATELERELIEREERAKAVRDALASVRRLLDEPPESTSFASPGAPPDERGKVVRTADKRPRRPAPPNRPVLRMAIPQVMRERGNPGLTLAAITEDLWRRGWVGTMKNGKPSKDTVRAVLLILQRNGVVRGDKQNDGPWAETRWSLTHTGSVILGHARAPEVVRAGLAP